jgi:hypothetical protein
MDSPVVLNADNDTAIVRHCAGVAVSRLTWHRSSENQPLEQAAPAASDYRGFRGACPHDCTDTCALHITLEDGRASNTPMLLSR